jgi:hypothetical protein
VTVKIGPSDGTKDVECLMTSLHYRGEAMETAADIGDQKQTALRLLIGAFNEADDDGVDPDCMTQAALFFALKEFVMAYGEEPVAKFVEGLPQRVRNGEFTAVRHG